METNNPENAKKYFLNQKIDVQNTSLSGFLVEFSPNKTNYAPLWACHTPGRKCRRKKQRKNCNCILNLQKIQKKNVIFCK